jgi:hypothetical protein
VSARPTKCRLRKDWNKFQKIATNRMADKDRDEIEMTTVAISLDMFEYREVMFYRCEGQLALPTSL